MVRVLRPAEVAERSETQDDSVAGGPVAEHYPADETDPVDWLMSAEDDDDWDEKEDDDEDDFDLDDEDDDDLDDEDE